MLIVYEYFIKLSKAFLNRFVLIFSLSSPIHKRRFQSKVYNDKIYRTFFKEQKSLHFRLCYSRGLSVMIYLYCYNQLLQGCILRLNGSQGTTILQIIQLDIGRTITKDMIKNPVLRAKLKKSKFATTFSKAVLTKYWIFLTKMG